MKKVRSFKVATVLMAATCLIGGTVAFAGTSYSSEKTVTVGKFSAVCPAHPSEQTKTSASTDGDISVTSVGGGYEIHAVMVQKNIEGYWMNDGSKIAISTGDKKKLPVSSLHTAKSGTRCYFNTSLTTYVDVNCTSKWRSN